MRFLRKSQPQLVLCLLIYAAVLAVHALAGSPIDSWPPYLASSDTAVWFKEPALESWDYLRARIVVLVDIKVGDSPATRGKALLEARTFADRAEQKITLRDFRVQALDVASAHASAKETLAAALEKALTGLATQADLNRFVEAFAGEKTLSETDISREVPKIFVSRRPALLLQFDGAPMWLPIKRSKISYGVNTNWDIFYDNKSTFYYLLAGDTWLATHDPFSNEWVVPKTLPGELKEIPRTPDFAHVWKHLPYAANADAVLPKVFYTEQAAELIILDGEPQLAPIDALPISVVTNTRSDLFYHSGTGSFYYLVAGRWFEAEELSAFWRPVAALPEEFARIPAQHASAHVLAQVAGTRESRVAALWAQVPQLASIRRDAAKLTVEFAGRPRFVPIDGTSLLWVPNATVPIVAQGEDLYACHHAVWFHAKDPKGPWQVADHLPADIYRIPPASPVFHLSFVRLVESNSESVTFGYTGGYENVFVSNGVAVYGTGYAHPPALQYGAYTYPVYFAQPATFGVGAWYDPDRHVFLRGRPGYGPFGGFGATSRYNSVTSHYFRAQTLYGDDLGDEPSLAFLPYTASYGRLTTVYDPYASWGEAVKERPDASSPSPKTVTISVGNPDVGAPGAAGQDPRQSQKAFQNPPDN